MSSAHLAPQPSGWSDDVLRRVVRAWVAGYGMTFEAFALGIGMVPRTFMRRLAGSGRKQAFSAGEVADIAAFMSRMTGDKVSIGDLYSGRITVFGELPEDGGPLAQSAELRTFNPSSEGVVIQARFGRREFTPRDAKIAS